MKNIQKVKKSKNNFLISRYSIIFGKMRGKTKNTTPTISKIVKEYKDATTTEIWEGIRDNFLYGFIGATLVVFIATRVDIAVLVGYLIYYMYVGRIVNRPKYVTSLGKLIVFPVPSALGAFIGYKISYIVISYLNP
jgi:hypothetical protein